MQVRERVGYAISVANNGPRGIEVAQKSQPDLVLLDVVMPEMDGYEVCRQLKADQQTAHIPVLFITGRNQETDLLSGSHLSLPIRPSTEQFSRGLAPVPALPVPGWAWRYNQLHQP